MRSSEHADSREQVWTLRQRGVLIGSVLVLCAFLFVRSWLNRLYISNPQPVRPARLDELADRLDPNVATWQELAVLPQLGEKRAREIVAYRNSHLAGDPHKLPFMRLDDLLRVKGIGVAMLETIRPHLMFPATQPTKESVRIIGPHE
jgi:hypothetical protein